MSKLIEKLKKYWNDPVVSGVIAGVIVSLILGIGSFVYAIIQTIFSKIPFKNTLNLTSSFLMSETALPIWSLVLAVILFVAFFIKPIIGLIKRLFKKKK